MTLDEIPARADLSRLPDPMHLFKSLVGFTMVREVSFDFQRARTRLISSSMTHHDSIRVSDHAHRWNNCIQLPSYLARENADSYGNDGSDASSGDLPWRWFRVFHSLRRGSGQGLHFATEQSRRRRGRTLGLLSRYLQALMIG